eukprot:3767644-Amphidinium_carterae.1
MTERMYSGVFPSDWKEAAHAQSMFNELRAAKTLEAKGMRARLGRWFQVPGRFREISRQLGFMVLAIAYAALVMG